MNFINKGNLQLNSSQKKTQCTDLPNLKVQRKKKYHPERFTRLRNIKKHFFTFLRSGMKSGLGQGKGS